MGRGAVAFAAGFGEGFLRQEAAQDERKRRDKADQRAQEEHDARMADVREQQDLKKNLKAAATPTSIDEGAGGLTKPETADNRDVGQPGDVGLENGGLGPAYRAAGQGFTSRAEAQAATDKYNSADGIIGRQAAAYRAAGRPGEALSLETASLQGKAAKLQLEKHERDFINEKFDDQLKQIGSPADAAKVLSGSALVGGKTVTTVISGDGKKVQFMVDGPDGQQVKFGPEFTNDAAGLQKVLLSYSAKMDVHQKVGGLQHLMQFEANRADRAEDVQFRDKQFTSTERHQRFMEGNASASLGLQREKFEADLKNDPTRNLPPATKMAVARLDREIQTLDQQIAHAQATNQWDPKSDNAMDLLARRNKATRDANALLTPYMTTPDGKPVGGQAAGGKPSYSEAVNGKPAGNQNPVPVGRVTTAATQAPTAVSAATAPTPAAAAAGPAQPARDPLLAAINPSGNPSLDASVQPKVDGIRQAAATLQAAQAEVTAAAQSGGNVNAAVAKAQAALNAMDALTKDMEPGMAKRVRQAAGLMV